MQPFRSFIKTLAEQESNTQFLGKMLCQGVKHWPGITAPGTEPVDSLVKGIQVFAPDFSFDRLDAPIDIADDAPSLHKLMGCSNGRMIIDNAIQKVKERVSEHELDDKITAVLADIHAVGKVTSLDSVVSQLQSIDKIMPEIRSMKCTKIQFGKKTGAEQELKKLHSSLAAKPLAALQPLLELLKDPRNDSSHLELVVTALDDVDNFAGGEAFAQYIDGAATEAKKDTSKAGKLLCSHLSDVQERYEEAHFFRAAVHDLGGWAILYSKANGGFDDSAHITQEQRGKWEKVAKKGAKLWQSMGFEASSWAALNTRLLQPFQAWSKSRGETEMEGAVSTTLTEMVHAINDRCRVANVDDADVLKPDSVKALRDKLAFFRGAIGGAELSAECQEALASIATTAEKFMDMCDQQVAILTTYKSCSRVLMRSHSSLERCNAFNYFTMQAMFSSKGKGPTAKSAIGRLKASIDDVEVAR